LLEEHHSDVPDIALRPLGNWLKPGVPSVKGVTDVRQNLDKKDDDNEPAADCGEVRTAASFCLEIEQHDDEEEQHHHCAPVNEDLDYADEKGVE
jgi:hypothetical protein